jgi:hypothetical protein
MYFRQLTSKVIETYFGLVTFPFPVQWLPESLQRVRALRHSQGHGLGGIRILALFCSCLYLAGCAATNISNNNSGTQSSTASLASSSNPAGSSTSGNGNSGGSSASGSGGSGGSSGPGAGASTFSKIEEMSGWYLYPDQGNPVCSPGPSLTSTPSMDGASGAFYLGPTASFDNCLWPILLGTSQTATHFTLDTYYRLSDPAYPQGIEFSSNKHIGTSWYKFSVQCSYYKGIFSVWDTAGARWSPTTIPCVRPALQAWDHLVVNTEISNGKAVFLSLTFNGVIYPINQSFYPITKPSSDSFGVHFQMDGNRAGNPYEVYVDRLTFTIW